MKKLLCVMLVMGGLTTVHAQIQTNAGIQYLQCM